MRIPAPLFTDRDLGPIAALPPQVAPGSGARVWLVRHAEVHEDWQQRAYGNLDVPLSATGVIQTESMSSAFRGIELAHVTSSHLARALAMGRGIAAATGAELAIDENLREIWRGSWQGLVADEFRARWQADRAAFLADPLHWKAHGGESDADVFDRAWPVLKAAAAVARGGTVALTTHFNVIRVLVTRALGLSPAQSFAFRNDPARATLLCDTPRGWALAASNVESPQGIAFGARGSDPSSAG